MAAFLVSTGVVTLAELGDKTQLLALVLAARFHKPFPIVIGILAATLANHSVAGLLGAWLTTVAPPSVIRWTLACSFFGMALWALVPDDGDAGGARLTGYGVFISTLTAFFLAEMGDKTQAATVMMSAQYQNVLAVVAGTTLGMMVANVPAVLFANKLVDRIPLRIVRAATGAIFIGLGMLILGNPIGIGV